MNKNNKQNKKQKEFQPQGISKQEEVLQMHDDFMTSVLNKGKDLPKAIVSQAQDKVAHFQSFKSEIDTDMMALLELSDALKQKITRCLKTDANPDGLLTHSEQEYLSCLVNQRKLEYLLRQDDAHWTDKLKKAKKDTSKVRKQMEEILMKSQQDLKALLMPE